MNKYTKMKTELENQKKYNLQLSTSLHKNQKRKSRIMSSSYKVNPSMIGNTNSFNPSYLFRITHFSHYFPRIKLTKKAKELEDNNDYQKIKEELDELRKKYETNENSYISQINILNKEIEDLKYDKEQLEENINELKINKNKEIEKEKQIKHRLLYEEKEKNKKEVEKLKKEIEQFKEEIKQLKDENNKIKNENENIINIKKALEEMKEKEKNYEKIINELKLENEKLLSQTTLNFKLIKEENDELIQDVKNLNDTINKMKIKEKEYKEYIEKEKEKKEKEKEKEEIEKQNKLKLMTEQKYNKNNLKVMRIFSNKFIFKNNNMTEIISKLKDTEKRYNELKKEKENIAQNNQNNIIITKEMKSLKEKYEKELKELKERNTNLNNQIKTINIKKISNNGITSNELKKVVSDITEHFNKILQKTQSKYDNKIISMKQKLIKIKSTLMKYIKNKNKTKNDMIMTELKEEISKIEKEKQKMKVQISNYDINFKKQNNEITKLKNELVEANKKLNKLNNEVRWNHNDKYELNDMNKKLKKQLEMYIIENNGKSKVIEERNNEIIQLKELLNKKQ